MPMSKSDIRRRLSQMRQLAEDALTAFRIMGDKDSAMELSYVIHLLDRIDGRLA